MEKRLALKRQDGSSVTFALPECGSGEQAARINTVADAIHDECLARSRSLSRSKSDTDPARLANCELKAWLRPLAYQLISACLEADVNYVLFRRSVAQDRYARGGPGGANPFQLGLMGILAITPSLLRDDERQRMGLSLWYAYRHYVPWQFLEGFTQQVGTLTSHSANEEIDPDFEEWVSQRRVIDFTPSKIRPAYPQHIEQQVRRLRQEAGLCVASAFSRLDQIIDGNNNQ